MSGAREFRDFASSHGYELPPHIEPGKRVRFPTNGKADDDAGWGLLFPDGQGGIVGNWRTGAQYVWQAKRDRRLSAEESREFQAKIEREEREVKAQREREENEAATRAAQIWEGAKPAPADHGYLRGKGVQVHGLRIYQGPQLVIRNMDCAGALIVPLWNAARIRSLEFIAANGEKRFLPGGSYVGCYFSIGTAPEDGEPLCISEGFATAASIHEATGYGVVAAMTAGNLEPVARSLRAKYPSARIIVCADDDAGTAGNPGLTKATEAARAVNGQVAIPDFGANRPDGATDFNDLAQAKGPEAVRAVLKAACLADAGTPPTDAPARAVGATEAPAAEGTTDDEIARLARLSPIEYDRERQPAADRLRVRASTLDAEVKKVRGDAPDQAAGEGVIFPNIEPWHEQVDGAELLNELARTVRRFVVLTGHEDDAAALWITLTYFADVVSVAPILGVVSPEKRCGKTSLLGVLKRLAHRPLAASNISPAALFRSVEKWSPTLLTDEADAFLRENDELRGMYNSGHTRDTAFVIRTVGDDHEPRRFSTWGLKAIALIGSLPDTLTDRSIVVELRRKHQSERVEKLRHAGDLEPLARRCLRFANDNREKIRCARPSSPEELHDRAGDNWEPLLAIADAAGADWPTRARKAASVLSGATPDGDSAKVDLLRDIRRLIEGDDPEDGKDRVPGRFIDRKVIGSEELVQALTEDKAGRWAEFSHGKPLSQGKLARLLRPFKITSRTVRLSDGSTPKGYPVDALKSEFARYLPPLKPPHRHKPANTRVVADLRAATDGPLWHFEKAPQANNDAGCGGVALSNPPSGDKEAF